MPRSSETKRKSAPSTSHTQASAPCTQRSWQGLCSRSGRYASSHARAAAASGLPSRPVTRWPRLDRPATVGRRERFVIDAMSPFAFTPIHVPPSRSSTGATKRVPGPSHTRGGENGRS